MSFSNRIRLPIKATRPQWFDTKTSFTKADGTVKTLAVSINKQYQLETDNLPEKIHERINIALGHDNVTIEGDKYLGGVNKNGDYTVTWTPSPLDFPLAKGTCQLDVTPFDASNSNCQTCEEASQLNLVDDVLPGELNENTEYAVDVATNDTICCWPAVFSISSFNAAYLSSAAIDQSGNVTFALKTGLVSAVGVTLVTYRVTCPNGNFDEANVIGDVNGTVPGCQAPTNLRVDELSSSFVQILFDASTSSPPEYTWSIVRVSDGVVVCSDTSPETIAQCSNVEPGTDYKFSVVSNCGGSDGDSNSVSLLFTTPPKTSNCGEYLFQYNNPNDKPAGQGGHINISYMDCNGVIQTIYVPNGVSRFPCAMDTTPGNPAYINSSGQPFFTFSYVSPCP